MLSVNFDDLTLIRYYSCNNASILNFSLFPGRNANLVDAFDRSTYFIRCIRGIQL